MSSLPGERWDVFCALPSRPGSILDVGCGQGFGFQSYRQLGVRLVGVDSDPNMIADASSRLDEAIVLDVESGQWPKHFDRSFDVVAFCDALEHFADPWAVLRSVRSLLTETGTVVASIPNLRQLRIIANLALGNWEYRPGAGTVQRDHLRFFTRRTIVDLFHEAGYETPNFFFPRRTFHLRRPERILNLVTLGRFADLFYGSYTISARPKSHPAAASAKDAGFARKTAT